MITLKLLAANYQILEIAPSPANRMITPAEIADLQLPTDMDLSREVILFGQVPIWVYGALIDRCHSASWIGCFAALEKHAVVIQSRVSTPKPGDVIPIQLQRAPGPAILIGGPPDSGKSVLSSTLRQSLLCHSPEHKVFLHRANWDGGGNWEHEAPDPELVKRLIRAHERRVHEHPQAAQLLPAYFNYHARATANLRELVDLVLVDVGGKVQSEKRSLREQCTHFILISRDPALVQPWFEFCFPTLKPIAVVHSVQADQLKILQTEPFLEIIAGPWNGEATRSVPDLLLQRVVQTIGAEHVSDEE